MAARMLDYDENGNVYDPQEGKPKDQTEENTSESAEGYFAQEGQTEQTDNQDETSNQDELPEELQGKTQAELIKMLQDSQKFSGRQSNEIGDLRGVIKDFIDSNTVDNSQPATQAPEQDDEDVDYFSDPGSAIDKRIAQHPSVKQAEQMRTQYEAQTAQSKLMQKHPDYQDVVQDPAFAEWVRGSGIRQRLLYEADQLFNFEAADELLSNWKDRTQSVKNTLQDAQKNRQQSVKSASAGTARGSAEPRTRKKLRASDLRRLKREKPDVYNDRSGEILLAYARGDVIRD